MALGWIILGILLFGVGLVLHMSGIFPIQVIGGALGMIALWIIGLAVVVALVLFVRGRLVDRTGRRGDRFT